MSGRRRRRSRASPTRRRRGPLPVPTWALLAVLIGVSTIIRLILGLRDDAAWIFPDETVYAELAKSLAYTGEFSLRDNPGTNGVGVVYPTLIAPAYALFDRVPDAHDGVKAINSLLMSLTAIPVYLIARRLVSRALALTAAGLSLAIPAMTYSGHGDDRERVLPGHRGLGAAADPGAGASHRRAPGARRPRRSASRT